MVSRAYRWWADRWCPLALARRLVEQVGWQATVLAVAIGPLWIGRGIMVLAGREPEPIGLLTITPAWVRALIWLWCGVLALAAPMLPSQRRWIVGLAGLMPALRVTSAALALLGAMVPWVPDVMPGEAPLDRSEALVSIETYAPLVVIVVAAALLPRDPHGLWPGRRHAAG